MALVSKFNTPTLVAAIAASALVTFGTTRASAEAMLLIEAETGKVLHAENATYPWYPASITKIMTAYVTLQAVKNKRLTLDSLLTMSARAASQAPSKMGFKPGTTVTVDNALKMLMVKSANDIAYLIAEGVGGSVEKFSDEMNAASRRLGMTQSNWVNPNGLPAEEQVSSARDLAILARAMLREFPEYDSYWSIPAIKFGKKMMRNTNSLIGRYPGANGMKTGFICASGFNLVATASRGGKRLIAVVLGSQSSAVRGAKTAGLLERGFNGNGLAWLAPSLGTVDALQAIDASPPDLREDMCGKHRKRPAAEDADDEPTAATIASGDPGSATALHALQPAAVQRQDFAAHRPAGPGEPDRGVCRPGQAIGGNAGCRDARQNRRQACRQEARHQVQSGRFCEPGRGPCGSSGSPRPDRCGTCPGCDNAASRSHGRACRLPRTDHRRAGQPVRSAARPVHPPGQPRAPGGHRCPHRPVDELRTRSTGGSGRGAAHGCTGRRPSAADRCGAAAATTAEEDRNSSRDRHDDSCSPRSAPLDLATRLGDAWSRLSRPGDFPMLASAPSPAAAGRLDGISSKSQG